jgi:hypothetical protein
LQICVVVVVVAMFSKKVDVVAGSL